MFWDDTPFEARIRFMLDNVMAPSGDFLQAYQPDAAAGYLQFRELLLDIFAAPAAFEGADALARFHALTYSTQVFFPAVIEAGAVIEDGRALHVSKAAFRKAYRKPSTAPFDTLPKFGALFEYTKKGQIVASYAACDAFTLRFPNREGILGALAQLTARFAEVDKKGEYAEPLVMLCKADFDRLLLGRPALRETVDPLRPDIVRATGDGGALYQAVVQRAKEIGLLSSISMQRYANPTWNINFLRGKKLRLKTIWCEGRNFLHVPIPFDKAEAVIRGRESMPPRIQAAIERFGCVGCGRCQQGNAVRFLHVDGITVCTGHGESSTIYLSLETAEEVRAVSDIIASLD